MLGTLQVPRDREVSEHLRRLFDSASSVLQETAQPVALLADITAREFAAVYSGEGLNAPDSVVAHVFPRAPRLTLFAVTLGPGTSRAIARAFASNDFAQAFMLDAVASEATDLAADAVQSRVERALRKDGSFGQDGTALRYSPGYCGWHLAGQRSLFHYLKPQRIGITLTEGGVMHPLKSVSGVILAGPRQIHRFSPTFPFCAHCETRSCLERMRGLFGKHGEEAWKEPARESPGDAQSDSPKDALGEAPADAPRDAPKDAP